MFTFSPMLICFFIPNETIIKNKRLANFREKRRRKSVRKSQNASFSVEISNILNWKQLQKLLFHFNEINSFRNSQINVTFNCLLTTKSFKKTPQKCMWTKDQSMATSKNYVWTRTVSQQITNRLNACDLLYLIKWKQHFS